MKPYRHHLIRQDPHALWLSTGDNAEFIHMTMSNDEMDALIREAVIRKHDPALMRERVAAQLGLG